MWHVAVPLGCPGCASFSTFPWYSCPGQSGGALAVLHTISQPGFVVCFLLIRLDRLVSWGCYPKCCKLLPVLEVRLPNSKCHRALLPPETQGRIPSCLAQLLGAPVSLCLCLCHMAVCSVSPLQVSYKDIVAGFRAHLDNELILRPLTESHLQSPFFPKGPSHRFWELGCEHTFWEGHH